MKDVGAADQRLARMAAGLRMLDVERQAFLSVGG